jgi:hypothetical protein
VSTIEQTILPIPDHSRIKIVSLGIAQPYGTVRPVKLPDLLPLPRKD